MKLYNTLSRTVEDFKPLHEKKVTMYACGPTVYDFTHIGHMRKYTMDDILKRTLQYLGYEVKHIMNITDVGHLVSDGDEGEDKLEKGAKKQGKTVWDVAKEYTDYFNKTMKAINVLPPDVTPKATDHIPGMIRLIQTLEEKGFTYNTKEAVYYDVTKFPNYGQLSGQKLEDKKTVRDDVHIDTNKKHPADFALWFKRVGRFADHTMHWESPWGDGFPGWHIECSAMSMEYLGETIDIHTGGIDHIPVHHENEIAQSEAATGKEFVKYWVHHAFLNVESEKMSKSKNNFLTVDDIAIQGLDPLPLRLLFLQAHYRQEMDFTWKSANSAENALRSLRAHVLEFKKLARGNVQETEFSKLFREAFKQSLRDDLNTAKALAVVWNVLRAEMEPGLKLKLMYEFDEVLGLNLREIREEKIPVEITQLATEREKARQDKNFSRSDELRQLIEKKGYQVEDTQKGYSLKKI